VRNSVWNAVKPRRSLLVHAYGHEVTGLKTHRGSKRKVQIGVCDGEYNVIRFKNGSMIDCSTQTMRA
jgi:hypothetical protein